MEPNPPTPQPACSDPQTREQSAGKLLVLLLPAIAAFLVFLPALTNDFVYDDPFELSGASGLLTPRSLMDFFWQQYGNVYRPIKSVTLNLDYRVWGRDPFGFHLTNNLLHALASALAAGLLLCVGFRWPAALAGAVWFAVHPIHTEPVCWVVARGGLLSAIGVFAAVAAFALWHDLGRRRWLAAAFAACAFAFFSREDSLPVLGAFAAYSWWRGGGRLGQREPIRRTAMALLLCSVPLIVYICIRQSLVQGLSQVPLEHGWRGLVSVLPGILDRYAAQLVAPFSLVLEPEIVYSRGFDLMFWGQFAVLLALCLSLFWRGLRPNLWKFALVWFFLFLIPVMGFVPINAPAADRYLYVSSFAGSLLVAALWRWLDSGSRSRRNAGRTAITVGCVLLAARTIHYERAWKSDETLWTDQLRKNPKSFRAWNTLAVQAARRDDNRTALEYATRSLQIKPDHERALVTRSYALARLGRREEAEQSFKSLLAKNPRSTLGMYAYCDLLESEGRWQETESMCERILEIDPTQTLPRFTLARLAAKRGDNARAVRELETALRYDPANSGIRRRLDDARTSAAK